MPADALIVERADRTHVAELVPLFDAYRSFYGQRSDPVAARRFLSERLEYGESVIFLARRDGDAVGLTQLYPSFSSVSLRRLWILNDLFVRADARHGGVARRLLERAAEFARETGAKGLTLATAVDNRSAQALYESTGWRRDEEFLHYDLTL